MKILQGYLINLVLKLKKKIKIILLDSYHISKDQLYEKVKNKATLIVFKINMNKAKSDITIIPHNFF